MSLIDGQGTPWGPRKTEQPGQLQLSKDPNAMQGVDRSALYKQLLASMAANRAATDQGTHASLGQAAPAIDPYAASRENRANGTLANVAHQGFQDRAQLLQEQQNRELQAYLDRLQAADREEAQRNEFWDKAGRTAYGGGKAILSYYSGGMLGHGDDAASKKKKSEKNTKDLRDMGFYDQPAEEYGPAGYGGA